MNKWLWCAVLASRLYAEEVQLHSDAWFGNPVVWRVKPQVIECARQSAHDFMCYTNFPVAGKVVIETVFTPLDSETNHWHVAGPAVYQDQQNYWRLALVMSPPGRGNRHDFEFCEMLDGEWLAQSSLLCSETIAKGTWQFNVPYRMRIELDDKGISGKILTLSGEVIFAQRYAFDATKRAVTCGRPALSTTGFTGRYEAIKAAGSNPQEVAACQYPPYAIKPENQLKEKATGFFHVAQMKDGRWWTIDPHGFARVLRGVDHVTFHGHGCQKLGYAPHGRKNKQKYTDKAAWEKETLERLRTWGFNMLGAGCDVDLQRRGLVHTLFLSLGDGFGSMGGEYEISPQEHRPCSVFPNVFHPDFEPYCRYQAALKCAPNRQDPWLLGYFIDNELAWWGRGALDTGLFDAVMAKGAAHSAKAELCAFLKEAAKGDINHFNLFWKTSLRDFGALADMKVLESSSPEQRLQKVAFLKHAARRYFDVTTRAMRSCDPNHLVLGSRFAGTTGAHPEVWKIAGTYCDIVTFNSYPMVNLDEGVVYTSLDRSGETIVTHFNRYYAYVNKPLLVTEWSFPALDSGLPCVHGAGQRFSTQKERTEATRLFARTLLALPYMLGYDYFMWVDEPALGISDAFPEDSNYGLINEDGLPYPLITNMFATLHQTASEHRYAPPPQSKDAESSQRKSLTALELARQNSSPSKSTPSMTRKGDVWHITNGRLHLECKQGKGPMVSKVMLDGQALGYYNAMIHLPGKWPLAERVTAISEVRADNLLVVDITALSESLPEKFEICQRLIIPPDVPFFVVQHQWLKNRGTEPFQLKGLFFQTRSLFSPHNRKSMVPNLWGRPSQGCWVSEKNDLCYGAVAPLFGDVPIHFWLDPQGAQHADARYEVADIPIQPGQLLSMDPYVLCLSGRDGPEAWEEDASRLVRP